MEALGEGEQAVALLTHRPDQRLELRLALDRPEVALPAVREQPDEFEPWQVADGFRERLGVRAVPLDPAPPVPRVHLDQHLDRGVALGEEGRRETRALDGIDAERNAHAALHQPVQPLVFRPADDAVGEADVVEAGVGEHLGFFGLGDGDAARAEVALPPGDGGGLVGFEVRTEGDALRVGASLHPAEVGVEPLLVDEQARRVEVGEDHRAGWVSGAETYARRPTLTAASAEPFGRRDACNHSSLSNRPRPRAGPVPSLPFLCPTN